MHIFCDFDGTISNGDTTDLVLRRLAPPAWERIEEAWEAGEIDAATCMREQIGLIRAPLGRIDAVLAEVGLAAGFEAFVRWAAAQDLPVTIVSDGVDYFIRQVLRRHGILLPVIANRLVVAGTDSYRLEQPHARVDCGSGVCKCAIVDAAVSRRPIVYIGDGRSDFCVSNRPDLLFAKSRLIDHCVAQATDFIPFTDFRDVHAALDVIRRPAFSLVA